MQYPTSVKLRHTDAKIVRRRGRTVVICKAEPTVKMTQRAPVRKKVAVFNPASDPFYKKAQQPPKSK
jgi:ribosomal protein L36